MDALDCRQSVGSFCLFSINDFLLPLTDPNRASVDVEVTTDWRSTSQVHRKRNWLWRISGE